MDKMTAAQLVRKLARQYEGMIEAANVLENIGSIENAAAEAQARTKEANASADAALRKVEEAKQAVASLHADAQAHLDAARSEGKHIIAAAKVDGESIVARAISEARRLEEQSRDAAEAARAEFTKEKAVLEGVLASMREEAKALQEELRVRAGELTDITSKLEQAREAARKLLG